ncbi:hypothetical protein CK203_025041 [Vitis vinifera]|uniref:Uncharacterized protein n=1 Tax=Vitis vinifera TaxID=29760 RepID=A0A438J710_VITVI|nr:hypothetical protein CK203_025041 [Vitis vinifera]
MVRCYEAGLDKEKQATSPSHGHLDMARAHTSMWGRHTDAPDAWSDGWCTLPSSEGLDRRHADGYLVTRSILRRRSRLVRGLSSSLLAPEMAGGSAMDALRERMTRMEEALGEWLGEEALRLHGLNTPWAKSKYRGVC